MRYLTISAKKTPLSAAREIRIEGLSQEDALKLAETLLIPFLRQTAGDVTVAWKATSY